MSVPNFTVGDFSQAGDIGRWGECLVANFLQNEQLRDRTIDAVHWPNSEQEAGRPYDFEIVYKQNSHRGGVQFNSVFVEVNFLCIKKFEKYHNI